MTRFANRTRYGRALAAIALVAVMAVGGFLYTGNAHAVGALPAPAGGLFAAGSSQPLTGTQLQHQPYETNPASAAPTVANATVIGPTASSQPSLFTVGFQMRNSAELAQIISEQTQAGSSMYHQWLTLAQEQAMFGPDPTAVQNTINYFTSEGFKVQTRGVLSVSFTGTTAMANTAFKTNLVDLRLANGSTVSVNEQPLSMPISIVPFVSTINGLNGMGQFHTTHMVDPTALLDAAASAAAATGAHPAVPAVVPSPAAPPGATMVNESVLYNFSNHAFGWVYYYSHTRKSYQEFQFITPGSLSYLYQALPVVNAGYAGNSTHTPITIAIVMGGGINPDDMRQYAQEVWNNPNQITNRLSAIGIDGAFGLNGTLYYTDGDSNEMALDIEYSSTMAPAAHILAVYGPGLFTTVLDDDYATLEGQLTPPNIISNSWGGPEDTFGSLYGYSWDNALTMHNYIMLLTARGSTVLASSADGGGFNPGTGMLTASYPASDPYVTSVDGIRTAVTGPDGLVYPQTPTLGWTNMTISPGVVNENYEVRVSTATQIAYQSYWYAPFSNYTLTEAPPEASGGFGMSTWFNQSWWQHGPFEPNTGRSLGSAIAAEADFNQSIYFDGTWELRYGGTSFACPTTAGMVALVEDWLVGHGVSGGRFLGNLNHWTTLVGNAWFNGNLSFVPYFDVTNGTSFWGNQGVAHGWSWPQNQNFPFAPGKGPVYGNTTVGWDFPTGWGVMNIYNFARDLQFLMQLPGQFTTLNSAGTAYEPSYWGNLALNNVYLLHVNATPAIQNTNPLVTVIFQSSAGGPPAVLHPTLVPPGLGPGYQFTLDTSQAPFNAPGYVYFELGNKTAHTLGFDYDWIAPFISPTGQLNVTVVTPSPSAGPYPGGDTIYNAFLGWVGGVYDYPNGFGQPYTNTFTVLVTDNGAPVYNAVVTGTIPSAYDIAFENSIGANRTDYHNNPGSAIVSNEISYSLTNVVGDALVQSANVIQPVTMQITATYGSLVAHTSTTIAPMPNVKPVDNYAGNYSEFNFVRFILQFYHLPTDVTYQNFYVPNSANQSAYYSMLYGWQGEEMNVSVNSYTGAPVNNAHVWLGNWDLGETTRFLNYEPALGVKGITNTSGTSGNLTGTHGEPAGQTTIYIPDNMTAPVGFNLGAGPYAGDYAGLDFLATSLPGFQNRTYSYTEPCAQSALNPTPLISCMYNSSYQRNYTTVPVVVFPDPINAWTQTRDGNLRDFFNTGSNISWGVKVTLPNNDPFLTGIGTNWNPGLEHVVSVKAYVDGVYAGDLTPSESGQQLWWTFGNLSGNYAPGIHTLRVIVDDSLGHVFTQRHIFIVGSVAIQNLPPSQVYSLMPFVLNWTVNIPYQEVSNKTFNMSLEIRYVTPGCGGIFVCPRVVNLSIPVHPEQVTFNQSINRSLLIKDGFYTGAGDLPPGQYQIIIWLNANHSGAVSQEAITNLVFDPLVAQINGPSANALVPVGNVTISYSYGGLFIQNAILSVYPNGGTVPVFQTGAVVPGIGTRGGSATWPSVQAGAYTIELNVSTPYQAPLIVTEPVNVTIGSPPVFINGTHGSQPVAGLPPVMTATALALGAAIIGLILGLLLAAPMRASASRRPGGPGSSGGRSSPKPWEEGSTAGAAGAAAASPAGTGPGSPGANVCSICHERFETSYALAQHAKITHGIEE